MYLRAIADSYSYAGATTVKEAHFICLLQQDIERKMNHTGQFMSITRWLRNIGYS